MICHYGETLLCFNLAQFFCGNLLLPSFWYFYVGLVLPTTNHTMHSDVQALL